MTKLLIRWGKIVFGPFAIECPTSRKEKKGRERGEALSSEEEFGCYEIFRALPSS